MSGFGSVVSKFHDELSKAMSPYRNLTMNTSEINKIVKTVPVLREHQQWIQPPDHCINHTNKGACFCAMTDDAIFERIRRGKYKIL